MSWDEGDFTFGEGFSRAGVPLGGGLIPPSLARHEESHYRDDERLPFGGLTF